MSQMTSWILVANSSHARVYEARGQGTALNLVRELEHPQSRQKAADLVSDRPGHAASGRGGRRTAYAPDTEVRRNEQEHFAHDIAHDLSGAHAERRFDKLLLVASAPFLGIVKSKLSKAVARDLIHTIDKDYTVLDAKALADAIRAFLPS